MAGRSPVDPTWTDIAAHRLRSGALAAPGLRPARWPSLVPPYVRSLTILARPVQPHGGMLPPFAAVSPEECQRLARLHEACHEAEMAAQRWLDAARIYANRGFHRHAIALYARALEDAPHLIAAHREIAAEFARVGMKAHAARHRLRATFLHTHRGQRPPAILEAVAHLRVAAAELLMSGHVNEYLHVAHSLLRLHDDDLGTLRTLAAVHLRRGELRDARRVLDWLLQLSPADPGVLQLLAQAGPETGPRR